MKLVKTQHLLREVVKEEIEHTFAVTQQERDDLLRAISVINTYKVHVLSHLVAGSDWHSVDFSVDADDLTVKVLVKHGMAG